MSLITDQEYPIIQSYIQNDKRAHPGQPTPDKFEKANEVMDFATVAMAQERVTEVQEVFSFKEFHRLLRDLDSMARQRNNEEVSAMIAEAVPAILYATRWAKYKAVGEYIGQRATGRQLVATWLRGVHVGDPLITHNGGTTGSGAFGLYGGTSNSVYSWLPTTVWTAGTAKTWLPSQVMYESAAIVVMGFLDTAEVPKVDGYRFTLNGTSTPVLPLKFNLQKRQSLREPALAKLVEPVILGPQVTVVGDLYPNKTGDSEPEPLAILVTMASTLTS